MFMFWNKICFFILTLFVVSSRTVVYAQKERPNSASTAEFKTSRPRLFDWQTLLRSLPPGGLPTLFYETVIRNRTVAARTGSPPAAKSEVDTPITIPVDLLSRRQSDPSVVTDVTQVEKVAKTKPFEKTLVSSQMPEVPLPKKGQPAVPVMVPPTVIKPALVPEKIEAKPSRIRIFLTKQILAWFKKTPPPDEKLIPEVEKRDERYPLVITATRLDEPLNRVGRSVTVIAADEMDSQGSYTLTEALRNVPGVRVLTQGQVGDLSSVRIRGTRSFDTIFLIDGMPFRDAADPQGSANAFVGDLFTDNFEQIEVMRGTGSTLYGSEAIGGVVHLRMKRGREGRPRATITYEGGSYHTHRQTYQLSGGVKGLDYFMSYSHVGTSGIRSADGYGGHVFGGNWGFKWEDHLELRFMLNANGSEIDVNDEPGFANANNNEILQDSSDLNRVRRARFVHYNSFLRHRLTDHFEHTFRFGFADTDRRFMDGPDENDIGFSDNQYDSNISNVEYQMDILINDHLSAITGLEHEREQLVQIISDKRDEPALYRFGWFLENRLSFFEDTLNFSAGGRLSHHKQSRTHQSGELSGSYLLRPTDTQIKGHFGTGFREPSLYELLGEYGNPNLKPEKSIGWDIGVIQKLFAGTVTMGAAFFKTEYSKRIIYTNRVYDRVDGGASQGLEFECIWQPIKDLKLGGSLTKTFAKADGQSIPETPRTAFGLNASWKFLNRFQYSVDLTYQGDQQALFFGNVSPYVRLMDQDSYTKVDIKLGFDINDHMTVWLRADNVFDAEFTERGYRNPGAQFFGGISMEI